MDRNCKSNSNIFTKIKSSTPKPNDVKKNDGRYQFSNPNKYNNFKGKGRYSTDKKNNYTDFNTEHGKKHKGALALALEEYKMKKIEEQKKREENKNKKEEMNQALQRYKEKKAQKLKRLCKKTKKGQPIMKYWIEDLLQKIESTS